MALPPGERLHGYEIVALLGAGGMGEVYRARDTRLHRDVALKVLPPAMVGNAAAFARFEREAQAVAALSHPNILAVHDLGQTGTVSYVVFELLEGATLRQRLTEGPLPARKAIDYARQIADGLAAAHARNITHRDIKPDNLFLTADGRVKILDFGLAQTTTPASGVDLTVTQAPITDAGTVLGTVGYMAPEQVRGQVVDHRADLFALGCVLYEMCTGQRAFKGDTPADTMTAVLSGDPPELTLSGQATPPALERIVRRCLEKQPTERFQSARDLSFALDALSSLSGSGSGAAVTAPAGGRRWVAPALAALAALAIGTGLGRLAWPAAPAEPVAGPPLRLEFASSSGGTSISDLMALSPDGRYLAYSDNASGTPARRLLVRDLGTGEVTQVPVTEGGGTYPVSWSPRSDELLYLARRELRRFRLGGRTTVPIFSTSEALRGGVWLPDDTVVFAMGGSENLRRMPASGGVDAPVVRSDDLFIGPTAIGTRSDYVLAIRTRSGSATNRQVVVVRLADGQVTPIIDNDAQPSFVKGSLLLPRPTGLFAAPFDEATLTLTGQPTYVGEPVIWDTGAATTSLTVSQTGVVAYRPGRDRALQFEWLDQAGRSLGLVGPPAFYGSFALSPDGTRIIVRQINQVGNRSALNLFLIDDLRKVAAPVSAPQGALSDPIWSADGSRILYRFEGTLVRQAPSSSTPEVLRREQVYPDAASPDGRWILGGMGRPSGGFGLYVMPADGSGERQVVAEDGRFTADEASFSPDGRLISYQSTRSGRPEIYLARFPLTDDRWQVSPDGGLQARWSDDGRTLYYLDLSGRLMRVTIQPSAPESAGRGEPMFDLGTGPPSVLLEQYAVHGNRFLVLRPSKDSAPQSIAVIGNWSGLLPRAAAPSR
jgi:eukaryotic-like serine/threonine-protein kinase